MGREGKRGEGRREEKERKGKEEERGEERQERKNEKKWKLVLFEKRKAFKILKYVVV